METVVQDKNTHFLVTVKDLSQISDGYHTIQELYDHRIILWLVLCKKLSELIATPMHDDTADIKQFFVWRSKNHSDGGAIDGWFLLGVGSKPGSQITYHLPMKYWDGANFAETLDRAPEFDGHTPTDSIERLSKLLCSSTETKQEE